ncbi:MAG: helix-turn-helix transcriptional regulator [Lachnospiraceae bacterium]|nr:helix-turn-helix transcriptional regulator [Lachnospiraceae bacterium]
MTKIQSLREELGMSKKQLAKKTGLSVAKLSRLEDECEEMLVSDSVIIARVLGVRPNTIRVLQPSYGCFPREKKR